MRAGHQAHLENLAIEMLFNLFRQPAWQLWTAALRARPRLGSYAWSVSLSLASALGLALPASEHAILASLSSSLSIDEDPLELSES